MIYVCMGQGYPFPVILYTLCMREQWIPGHSSGWVWPGDMATCASGSAYVATIIVVDRKLQKELLFLTGWKAFSVAENQDF